MKRKFAALLLGLGFISIANAPTWAEEKSYKFDLGTEAYSYKYTENIGVRDKGIKGGLIAAFTYKWHENEIIKRARDLISEGNQFNSFKLEGRLSYGTVDYQGSGSWDGIPDWNFEGRGLLNYDIALHEKFVMTPYLGIGYRYLFNQFSDLPSRVIDGQAYYSGYDRESSYFYLPVGLENKIHFTDDWSLSLKGEFDIFLWGKQISHFEDQVTTSGLNARFSEMENKQKKGLGWRYSARLSKAVKDIEIFVEPFVRYWHIKDSKTSNIIQAGSVVGTGWEPDNKTWEYGASIGAKF